MLGGPRSALEFYRNRGRGAVITASVLPPSCGRSQKNGFVSIVSARVGHHPPDLRAIMAGRKERAPSGGGECAWGSCLRSTLYRRTNPIADRWRFLSFLTPHSPQL